MGSRYVFIDFIRSYIRIHESLVVLLLMYCLKMGYTQNLVPNPGFEEILEDPVYGASGINQSPDWITLEGSTDFFHQDYGQESGIPSNLRGHQDPASGDGYAGIFPGPSGAKEFLGAKLLEGLKAGALYDISFKVNRSTIFRFATDDLGMVVLEDYPDKDSLNNYTYVIRNAEGSFVTDTLNWITIRGHYLAKGNEQYILIGNIFPDHRSDYKGVQEEGPALAYYFIDDVVVAECSDPEVQPLVYDTSYCDNQELVLSGLSSADSHYWEGLGTTKDIIVTSDGRYVVNNYYQCGVIQQQYEVEFVPCDCSLSVPTLYNQINRIEIRPSANVLSYRFLLYNALGQIMLETEELELDAMKIPYASAPYFWSAQLTCIGANEQIFSKNVSGKLIVQN